MSQFDQFLNSKLDSTSEITQFSSLLLLSAKGREDLLSTYTIDKIRQTLDERRKEKWLNNSTADNQKI